MTHITKLTEIVDGRLLPSDKKLSASLLEVDAGRLTVSGDTLDFDETGLATETFVTNAIANAQLGGGEVDLSGYATTEELIGAFNELNTGMTFLVADEVNAAIASVVDNAPATFDTLKEIATWIETEGVDTAGLAASIAGKADKSDLAEFKNETEINALIDDRFVNIYGPGMASNLTNLMEQTQSALGDKVDKIEGKGLSTNDYTDADKAKVDGIDTSISTAVNAAITGKADRTELDEFRNEAEINTLIETYVMETYNPQLGSNITLLLDNKVDKVEGKGLSTEDFTTAYKTKLDGIDEDVRTLAGDAIRPTVDALWEEIGGVSEVLENFDNQKLNIPTSVDPSTITTPTVNSVPLYTLGNNGDYVLCTPDTWLNINGFLVPGYNPTTLGV